jgi:hypothetical protein
MMARTDHQLKRDRYENDESGEEEASSSEEEEEEEEDEEDDILMGFVNLELGFDF